MTVPLRWTNSERRRAFGSIPNLTFCGNLVWLHYNQSDSFYFLILQFILNFLTPTPT